MSVLTDKQKHDLNESIMEYLHAQGLHTTYAAMRTELASDHQPNPKSKFSDLLEKKWTAVIRLQKKVRELEDRNAMLQEELNAAPSRRANTETDWVPRAPARYTFTGHRSPVTSVAFHPLFTLVASASEDATIKIWDWETGEFERTLKGHTKQVWGVDFGSTGENLASCSSDATIKLWSTADWDKANYSGRTLRGHEHTVSSVKFMPGDEEIVSASRDTTIRIWNVASAYCVRTLRGHDNWVRMCVPSSDGALLASCSNDYTAQIWDPKSGNSKMVFRGHDHNIEGVTFAPICAYPALCELAGILVVPKTPGAFVATASRDKTIRLWDVASGQELRVIAGHNDWVRNVVFHPNGKFLLSASDDKTIRVWELSTGRCVKVVEAHTHFVSSIAWGPAVKTGDAKDGEKEPGKFRNVVASGSVDQSVRIWLP